MTLPRNFRDDLPPRIRVLGGVMLSVLCICLLRLGWWQLQESARWLQSAQVQEIRTERLPTRRGAILDRTNRVLVSNRPVFQLWLDPARCSDAPRTIRTVATLLGRDSEALLQSWKHRRRGDRSRWLMLPEISRDAVAQILARRSAWLESADTDGIDGVDITPKYLRTYQGLASPPPAAKPLEPPPHAPMARYITTPLAHLLGTIREVGPREIAKQRELAEKDPAQLVMAPGDLLGVSGVEAAYDKHLRGIDGVREYLVDARGQQISVAAGVAADLLLRLPQPGDDLHLTIDLALQQAAEAAFGDKRGALVALDPRTGAILAMVSRPGLDNGALTGPDRSRYWSAVLNDPATPLIDRTIQGAYPPGSIYKMVVAMAALNEGLVTPTERITCIGGLQADGRRFGCHRKAGHGPMELVTALAQSCDVYFYELGRRLGVDRLARYAERFGLGQKSGLGLPHERSGLIPTTAWRARVRGIDRFSVGETFAIAIGQGMNLFTPLQAAIMVATIANDGVLVAPTLRLPPSGELPRITGEPAVPLPIVRQVQRGMIAVVEGGGTAGSLKPLKLKIAGKTGTAQVVGLLRAKAIGLLNDHAWFVAYAPYDDPQLALALIVEHGGHGGAAAAPIAGEVFKTFFRKQAP